MSMRDWKEAWHDPGFRVQAAATAIALPGVLTALTGYLAVAERRAGVVLPDPILGSIPPVDLTWLTFGAIYCGLLLGLRYLLPDPRRLLMAVQAYGVMICFRLIAMALVPFEAPAGLIPLRDPVVQFVGTGGVPTKDLFFSGHTATLFLLALVSGTRRLRWTFLALAAIVAVAVIAQHVHYAIDVYMAPFVSYAAYRIVRWIASPRGARGGDPLPRESNDHYFRRNA